MILRCTVCGQEMEAQKSTKKYCSHKCELEGRKIRKKMKAELRAKGIDPDIKHCLICEKEFKPKDKNANQRLCCYDCMPEGHQMMRSEFINLIREKRGGRCQKCGYDKYKGALEFHHTDPSKKDFTVGDRDFKLKDCIEETKKCILICANCHREIHAGLWDISEISEGRK